MAVAVRYMSESKKRRDADMRIHKTPKPRKRQEPEAKAEEPLRYAALELAKELAQRR